MLLHILVLAPFVAALLIALAGSKGYSSRLPLFLASCFVSFSVALIALGDVSTTPLPWFKLPGSEASVTYHLGTYTLNAWLVFLSCILTLASLVSARTYYKKEYKNFAIGLFVLLGTMNGAFLALDAVLFFFFFEAMVIPAAILIASYGNEKAKSGAMTFAIYTLIGSLPMALALFYMVAKSGSTTSFVLFEFVQKLNPETQTLLTVSFLIAFLVKTPVFPFHGWQAITYIQAPAPVSAILTGAMSKVGVYGILIWVLSIFPNNPVIDKVMLILALITAIYGALIALRAKDIKKVLAFSSMGHLGLAVAVIFTFSPKMLPAVLVLLVAHGLSAGGLFLLSGFVSRAAKTRDITQMGGFTSTNPIFAFFFGLLSIIALSVPGTAGFVGEFLSLSALFDVGPLPAVVGGLCLILSAAYMLRLVQCVLFGTPKTERTLKFAHLEGFIIGIFAFCSLLFGLHPAFIYEVRVNPETEIVDSQNMENSSVLTEEETKKMIDEMTLADSTEVSHD